MRHVSIAAVVVVGLAWSGAFDALRHVLALTWPVLAVGLMVVASCAALAASLWIVGLAVRSLRLPGDDELHAERSTIYAAPHRDLPMTLDYSPAWQQETCLFAFIGNMAGFSLRSMLGYVTRDEWETFVSLLAGAGVLSSGKGGTRWERGWTYGRLRAELRAGVLSLPYPDRRPPRVRWSRAGETGTGGTAHTGGTGGTAITERGALVIGPMPHR